MQQSVVDNTAVRQNAPFTARGGVQVLIVGAGPVGLTLACDLAWRDVPIRIIDAHPEPSRHSKAIGVFSRTLELLENLEVADEMVRSGVRVDGVLVYAGATPIARVDTRHIASHYNFVLSLEQSATERILMERLRALGVQVERPVRLTSLQHRSEGVEVVLERADGERESLAVPWVVGCDGAHSSVRKALGLPFAGERYAESFSLADVHIAGAPTEAEHHIQVFLAGEGMLFMAPLAGGRQRLIVNEPPAAATDDQDDPTLNDVRRWWRQRVPYSSAGALEVTDAEWVSRFTIHRRMVPKLRERHVFLAGDAVHIHSPAGAQGMNTGIQDALNLGWKLALVAHGQAPQALLDTYNAERLPIAKAILAATHLVTAGMTARHPLVLAARNQLMRRVVNVAALQRRGANRAAGLQWNYRGRQSLRATIGGFLHALRRRFRLAAGDRAPDVVLAGPEGQRLYDRLRHPGHTLLIFVGRNPAREKIQQAIEVMRRVEEQYGSLITCQLIMTQQGHALDGLSPKAALVDVGGRTHARYGLSTGGLCLIRPDRYVAFHERGFDLGALHVALAPVLMAKTGAVVVR